MKTQENDFYDGFTPKSLKVIQPIIPTEVLELYRGRVTVTADTYGDLLNALHRIAAGEFANNVPPNEQVAALRKIAREAVERAISD